MKKERNLNLPAEGFCRLPQVLHAVGISKTTWWGGIKSGRFPKPAKLGGASVWKVEDIRRLINAIGSTY